MFFERPASGEQAVLVDIGLDSEEHGIDCPGV
jgi:hypothetical protein